MCRDTAPHHPFTGMAVVQLAFGVFRPTLTATSRGKWRFLHYNWGRLVLTAAWAELFLGVVLFHELEVCVRHH